MIPANGHAQKERPRIRLAGTDASSDSPSFSGGTD